MNIDPEILSYCVLGIILLVVVAYLTGRAWMAGKTDHVRAIVKRHKKDP